MPNAMPASRSGTTGFPTILFGAFDRHNFGDLLLPHVMRSLIGQANPFYGGLAERNLRIHGGHRVHTLARLAATVGDSRRCHPRGWRNPDLLALGGGRDAAASRAGPGSGGAARCPAARADGLGPGAAGHTGPGPLPVAGRHLCQRPACHCPRRRRY
ncbi:hypothetical protein CNECB9_760014 [Cupriavidus necator]|uniref:Uncharacterized protein n=1 Tax=Cupriavidus necator TaxID=106590 RepID=A0A1K0JQZ4_CUPNE|nr:hypothetical protein CNECB9_760014 [Cupriavidus necator]